MKRFTLLAALVLGLLSGLGCASSSDKASTAACTCKAGCTCGHCKGMGGACTCPK